MKMRTLFNLLDDAQEIAELFSKIETPEQMVSFLERLKKTGAPEFLESVQSLRISVEAALEDTMEMGGSIGGNLGEDDFGEDEIDEDVDDGQDLLGDIENEDTDAENGVGNTIEDGKEEKIQPEVPAQENKS